MTGSAKRKRVCPTCDGSGTILACPFKIGDYVTWQGQLEAKCVERVVKITEPQHGNYVLWVTLSGKDKYLFPINTRQVEAAPRQPGAGKGARG